MTNKSLTDRICDLLEQYAADKGLDAQLTFDAFAVAVSNVERQYRAKIREAENVRRQTEFNKQFEARKLEYQSTIAKAPYPYEVKRQWITAGNHVVDAAGIRKSIFEEEGN